mmetsp:Transcript_34107/g.54594  ORF Transcript_34107/g.54594 Transcript_34107/m.54594 type:complete len:285 (+) Transcript_34107:5674-6528(+)
MELQRSNSGFVTRPVAGKSGRRPRSAHPRSKLFREHGRVKEQCLENAVDDFLRSESVESGEVRCKLSKRGDLLWNELRRMEERKRERKAPRNVVKEFEKLVIQLETKHLEQEAALEAEFKKLSSKPEEAIVCILEEIATVVRTIKEEHYVYTRSFGNSIKYVDTLCREQGELLALIRERYAIMFKSILQSSLNAFRLMQSYHLNRVAEARYSSSLSTNFTSSLDEDGECLLAARPESNVDAVEVVDRYVERIGGVAKSVPAERGNDLLGILRETERKLRMLSLR